MSRVVDMKTSRSRSASPASPDRRRRPSIEAIASQAIASEAKAKASSPAMARARAAKASRGQGLGTPRTRHSGVNTQPAKDWVSPIGFKLTELEPKPDDERDLPHTFKGIEHGLPTRMTEPEQRALFAATKEVRIRLGPPCVRRCLRLTLACVSDARSCLCK